MAEWSVVGPSKSSMSVPKKQVNEPASTPTLFKQFMDIEERRQKASEAAITAQRERMSTSATTATATVTATADVSNASVNKKKRNVTMKKKSPPTSLKNVNESDTIAQRSLRAVDYRDLNDAVNASKGKTPRVQLRMVSEAMVLSLKRSFGSTYVGPIIMLMHTELLRDNIQHQHQTSFFIDLLNDEARDLLIDFVRSCDHEPHTWASWLLSQHIDAMRRDDSASALGYMIVAQAQLMVSPARALPCVDTLCSAYPAFASQPAVGVLLLWAIKQAGLAGAGDAALARWGDLAIPLLEGIGCSDMPTASYVADAAVTVLSHLSEKATYHVNEEPMVELLWSGDQIARAFSFCNARKNGKVQGIVQRFSELIPWVVERCIAHRPTSAPRYYVVPLLNHCNSEPLARDALCLCLASPDGDAVAERWRSLHSKYPRASTEAIGYLDSNWYRFGRKVPIEAWSDALSTIVLAEFAKKSNGMHTILSHQRRLRRRNGKMTLCLSILVGVLLVAVLFGASVFLLCGSDGQKCRGDDITTKVHSFIALGHVESCRGYLKFLEWSNVYTAAILAQSKVTITWAQNHEYTSIVLNRLTEASVWFNEALAVVKAHEYYSATQDVYLTVLSKLTEYALFVRDHDYTTRLYTDTIILFERIGKYVPPNITNAMIYAREHVPIVFKNAYDNVPIFVAECYEDVVAVHSIFIQHCKDMIGMDKNT